MNRTTTLIACSIVSGSFCSAKPEIEFNRDIRPILSKNCIACHGPDEEARKAELRLDTPEGATAELDGLRALVPGRPGESELVARVETDDPDDIMPPPKSGHVLTPAEKSLLRRWVAEGGGYQEHWAFVVPSKAALPAVRKVDWPRHPLDHFILARLEAEGMAPSMEADRTTWLRRVSLDLTGLPPSTEEAEAFLSDRSETAWEKVVDRLLGNSAYGEHWARMWLDLARYADTKGYEKDRHRNIWRYRDWVIQALNQDMPFDRFTIEQLAGDLLPDPTLEQLVATAFHRNTMVNDEGGTDDEEFRVAAVKDRVDTTIQVWMGLTMGCAKCHDHKYDPIQQPEYYRFYDLFNQTEDADLSNDAPTLKVPTGQDANRAATLENRLAEFTSQIEAAERAESPVLTEWLQDQLKLSEDWETLVPDHASAQGSRLEIMKDHSVLAGGQAPDRDVYLLEGTLPAGGYHTLRLDVLTHPSLGSQQGPGRNPADPNFVLSEIQIALLPPGGGEARPLSIRAARADYEQQGWPVQNAIDGNPNTGWAVSRQFGMDHLALFLLAEPLQVQAGDRLRVRLSQQYGNRLLFGRVRVAAGRAGTEEASMSRLQTAQQAALLQEPMTGSRRTLLRRLRGEVDGATAGLRKQVEELKEELAQLDQSATTVPVMREKHADKRRVTRIHERGNFLNPGDPVEAGLPAAFGQLPEGAPTNRLGVAQWLMDDANPLTARVMVNRLWARLFGIGIVETEEDFGVQGLMPSHPGLLDWLAVDFREQGWSMKQLLRGIVLSSTYRQSARLDATRLAADPRNRLLGRGPRFRLSAETLRDQALAVSGLLTRKVGGPSVMPPQPKGVWKTTYSGEDWKNAVGPDRYRRGLYTYLKRTSPYPAMLTFDAGSGEVCQIRRVRTNTPLQALVTLNDPAFVEAAGALAARMEEGGDRLEEKITTGFQRVLLRDPQAAELARLVQLYHQLKEGIADGQSLLEAAGRKAGDPGMVAVANVLLNLDETLMKP